MCCCGGAHDVALRANCERSIVACRTQFPKLNAKYYIFFPNRHQPRAAQRLCAWLAAYTQRVRFCTAAVQMRAALGKPWLAHPFEDEQKNSDAQQPLGHKAQLQNYTSCLREVTCARTYQQARARPEEARWQPAPRRLQSNARALLAGLLVVAALGRTH